MFSKGVHIHHPAGFLKFSSRGKLFFAKCPSEREHPSGQVTGVRRKSPGLRPKCAKRSKAFFPHVSQAGAVLNVAPKCLPVRFITFH